MEIDANFRGAKPYDHTHLHFIDCHNFFENGINRTEMFSALIPWNDIIRAQRHFYRMKEKKITNFVSENLKI